ncbi:MAG: hypothetical protein R6V18_09710 [Desulfuromonadaceae bacterium]
MIISDLAVPDLRAFSAIKGGNEPEGLVYASLEMGIANFSAEELQNG